MTLYTRPQLVVLLIVVLVAGTGLAVGHWRRTHPDIAAQLESLDRTGATSSADSGDTRSLKPDPASTSSSRDASSSLGLRTEIPGDTEAGSQAVIPSGTNAAVSVHTHPAATNTEAAPRSRPAGASADAASRSRLTGAEGTPHSRATGTSEDPSAWRRSPPRETPAQPIDINRATEDELRTLPGIGSVLAARIVQAREREGPFASLDDLRRVPGLGRAKLDRIAAAITLPR